MKSGSLDRNLTVLKRTVQGDGGWGSVAVWLPWLKVRARVEYTSEDEKFAAGELYSERILTFETRWFAGVDERDRLYFEGQYFDIIGVRELDRRRGLEFKAQWRVDNPEGPA